jgi:hypothetical protein
VSYFLGSSLSDYFMRSVKIRFKIIHLSSPFHCFSAK